MPEPPATPPKHRLPVFYVATIAVALALFFVIQHYGTTTLEAPPPADKKPPLGVVEGKALNAVFHVLLAMAAVIVVGRGLGLLLRFVRQPPVIGEVLGGIVLGPSVLGWLAPDVQAFLLPAEVAPYLKVIAQLGVILYMFLVGLELNTGLLRERGAAAAAVSHASILFPFLLGAAFALFAYPRLSFSDVPFTVFALFLGVSLSVTAFPVLARILSDRGLSRSPLGTLALACAAIDDVTAWCLLALVVGVAQAHVDRAVFTIVAALAYIALMLAVVRPIMARLVRRFDGGENLSQGLVALVFLALLGSALVTEWIGIHAIFGAFLMGAVIPHDSRIARKFIQKLEDLVGVLLLPAFFAFTGMRTEIGLVAGWENGLICLAIIVLATLGKFCGSAAAARLGGLGWRDAAAIGILMNTRGLMELIVLNVGLDLGVVSPTLFAMLVLMAIVTTVMTTPILDLLMRRDKQTAGQRPAGKGD